MTRQQLEDFIRLFYDRWNRRDWRQLEPMFADPYICRAFWGDTPISPKAFTRFSDRLPADHVETINEVVSIDTDTGWVTVYATGRGTLTKPFYGMAATGRQYAGPLLHSFRIVNGKITESKEVQHFDLGAATFDQQVTAPFDVQPARAEQGGSILTGEQIRARRRALEAYSAGALSAEDLSQALSQTAEPPRCQFLLLDNFRRCQRTVAGSDIWCSLHQQRDPVHEMPADFVRTDLSMGR